MGVDQASINTLPLATCTGTVHMTQGPIVLIMNQYDYYGKGSTVDCVGQLPHFGLELDNQSSAIAGHKQCMTTPNWRIIPFNIINGSTKMPIHPSADEDLDNLPHVIVTSDDIWDPTILDHLIDIENDIYHPAMDPMIDKKILYLLMTPHPGLEHIYIMIVTSVIMSMMSTTMNKSTTWNLISIPLMILIIYPQCMIKDQDYEALCPSLLWLPIDHIKQTLATTTQWFHKV